MGHYNGRRKVKNTGNRVAAARIFYKKKIGKANFLLYCNCPDHKIAKENSPCLVKILTHTSLVCQTIAKKL